MSKEFIQMDESRLVPLAMRRLANLVTSLSGMKETPLSGRGHDKMQLETRRCQVNFAAGS